MPEVPEVPEVPESPDPAGAREPGAREPGAREPGMADLDDPDVLPEPPLYTVPPAEALGLTPASEVARAALNRAKAAARNRGAQPGRPVPRTTAGGATRGAAARSGPGRDGRDPVLFGDTLSRLAAERGWSEPLSVGGVVGRWREVVGAEIAEHCTPETFEDGLLVVRADSTTWATNLRLLTGQLLGRLAEEVGPDVVTEVRVLGPAGPRWAKGKRSVPGRGPRDTYG